MGRRGRARLREVGASGARGRHEAKVRVVVWCGVSSSTRGAEACLVMHIGGGGRRRLVERRGLMGGCGRCVVNRVCGWMVMWNGR